MAEKRSPTGHRTKSQMRAHARGYGSRPKQEANRRARMKNRYAAEKAGKVSKGDGKDVAHKKALAKGGGNAKSNLKVTSRSSNRGHGTSPGGTRSKR